MIPRVMPPRLMPPGLMIAAAASGTSKTTEMLGLLCAFRDAELTIQPFKSDPDDIDPAFHRAASARPSFNLDSWAMSEPMLQGVAGRDVTGGLPDGLNMATHTGTNPALILYWPLLER